MNKEEEAIRLDMEKPSWQWCVNAKNAVGMNMSGLKSGQLYYVKLTRGGWYQIVGQSELYDQKRFEPMTKRECIAFKAGKKVACNGG